MKSATLRKQMMAGMQLSVNPTEPRRFYEEPGKIKDKKDIQGMTWMDEYFNLQEKIERMEEENEKQKREIARRTERYIKNEAEYRKEINELERELRVRKGFEEGANERN